MMFIIYLMMMLKDGCCQEFPTIETKAVYVGDLVKLACSRRSAGDIVWMKINSENTPEILGQTENMYRPIKVWQDVGLLVLQIMKARLIDSGFYLCQRNYKGNKTFLNLTYLRVKDSAVTTVSTPAPPQLHNSVTLYCSALHHPRNKSCPGDENLLCFRAESNQTLPGLNYTDNDEEDRFKFNSEGCFYSYFKNTSLSGAQMYHCAVAKHNKNLSGGKSNPVAKHDNNIFGEKSNSDTKGNSSNYNTVLCLLSAALAICLVVIAFLIYFTIQVNKKLNDCSNATVALQAHEPMKENQEGQKFPQEEKPAEKGLGTQCLKYKMSSTLKSIFLCSKKAKLIVI
ncbi:uncharacterized protein LOC124860736 isoform X1 [Girardinichthys multiradiatus]|uniref:uncharacterized protein LOC124860736 isoform X1 n=3 Tax=Girardinichthys multiradiatus TaxID=208333 RepID=UPI001FAE2A5F|nr:uncharacterized protein LOC124860736 isoform X1 [Girardinichthys multiradiatus]